MLFRLFLKCPDYLSQEKLKSYITSFFFSGRGENRAEEFLYTRYMSSIYRVIYIFFFQKKNILFLIRLLRGTDPALVRFLDTSHLEKRPALSPWSLYPVLEYVPADIIHEIHLTFLSSLSCPKKFPNLSHVPLAPLPTLFRRPVPFFWILVSPPSPPSPPPWSSYFIRKCVCTYVCVWQIKRLKVERRNFRDLGRIRRGGKSSAKVGKKNLCERARKWELWCVEGRKERRGG